MGPADPADPTDPTEAAGGVAADRRSPPGLRVQVVYSPVARAVESREVQLAEGATIAAALQGCGLFPDGLPRFTEHREPALGSVGMVPAPGDHAGGVVVGGSGAGALALSTGVFGLSVWGRRRPLEHRLRDGDRVEVCRPLQSDPKEARRLRGRRQPPKAAPLRQT